MKRPRFGTRERIPRGAAELQRLALGLADAGSRLEMAFWETRLATQIENMLADEAEEAFNTILDKFYETQPLAADLLAEMLETRTGSRVIEIGGQPFDILLFAAPILAWSRYAIPSGAIGQSTLETLEVQLGAHVFSREARLIMAEWLFSPDQLPQSYCHTRCLLDALQKEMLTKTGMTLEPGGMPETRHFLSDIRYLLGAVIVPHGAPVFRWNETDGNREKALSAWEKQGAPSLAPLMAGCAYQFLLPNAYYFACRQADELSRAYALKASVAFLQTTLGLMPEELRAVVAPCFDQRLEEYRIGLAPRDREHLVYHGVVWALLGAEDEHTDIFQDIEAVLREHGIKDVVMLDHRMPIESCEDCGAPLFPTADGELVHAGMPDQDNMTPPILH
jgi:hypothetical protein